MEGLEIDKAPTLGSFIGIVQTDIRKIAAEVGIVVKACLPEALITCCHVTMCSATLSRTFDTCIYKRSPPPSVSAAVVVQ